MENDTFMYKSLYDSISYNIIEEAFLKRKPYGSMIHNLYVV
jgi:hypothetical protein